jgi:cobalt-zinc-cadmium efflux system protein
VHDLHIWPLSTTSTALTAHIVQTGATLDDGRTAMIVDGLQRRFHIDHTTLQFETGDLDCALEPDGVV